MEKVAIGQKVYSILYGGRNGIIYDIKGEQQPGTIHNLSDTWAIRGGNAHMYIVFEDGTKSVIPEAILHGCQWRIYDKFATDTEIAEALKFAVETEEKKRLEAETEKQRQEREKDRIIKEYPYLMKVSESKKLGSYAVGAKNLKKELTKKFPGVAFSVKSESYSMGCSISIYWTDGPTVEEVEKISSKYKTGHFNGMEDIYEYDSLNVWPSVFGGAKYVSENRQYSQEAKKKIVENLNFTVTFGPYDGIKFKDEFDEADFYRKLRNHSFYQKPEVSKPEKSNSVIKNQINKDDNSATKRQLWVLHCITRMDTREWKLTFNQADQMIKAANRGENIKDLVKDFIAC